MVKYQFGKNWSWCADLPPEHDHSDQSVSAAKLDLVYKLDSSICHFGSCKTNCAQNPYCLNGLGEKKLIGLLQKEPTPPLDRSVFFRSSTSDECVGLVNLGATCYINAYLQVWFNNLFFREKILQMPFEKARMLKMAKDQNDESGSLSSSSSSSSPPSSQSIPEFVIEPLECLGASFQLIFTLMKETIRKSIDTSFFIQSIGLDQHVQQDAQEFSQLFLTTLQRIFKAKLVDNQRQKQTNLIEDLFQGEISYITECSNCQLRSVRNSNFVELTLNIQNSSTITDCVEELLKDEIMDGDNQYHCGQCESKRDARRITQLDTLPPVLNMQLLRFIYDRNTGSKKKLSSRIKFYEQLDLNKYVKKQATKNTESSSSPNYVYQLGSILMHVGKSAYSGHYTAQIRNFESQEWFNFNDESINKIKKKQQLGCTDEEADTTTAAAAKKSEADKSEKDGGGGSEKATTSSKSPAAFSTANAYLLVYYRTDWVNKFMGKRAAAATDEDEGDQEKQMNGSRLDMDSPSNQSECVREDNQNLEGWFSAAKNSRMDQSEIKMTERTFIKDVYDKLWVTKSSETDSKKVTTTSSGARRAGSRTQRQIVQSSDNCKEETTAGTMVTTPPSSPPSDLLSSQTPKEDMFFMPAETIKQIMSGEWINSGGPATTNSGSGVKKKGGQSSSAASSSLANLTPMTKYLCSHRRLNPLAINRVKLVSRSGLELIKSIYSIDLIGSGAVLPAYDDQTTRCRVCVRNCVAYLRCKEKLKFDSKLIEQILDKDAHDQNEYLSDVREVATPSKRGYSESNGSTLISPLRSRNGKGTSSGDSGSARKHHQPPVQYWIGKETLRQWPQLALRRHESLLPSAKFVDNSTDGGIIIEEMSAEMDGCEIVEIKSSGGGMTAEQAATAAANNDTKSSLDFFNQDILCPHDQLSPTTNKRLVMSSVWQKIYNMYFEDDASSSFDDPHIKIFTCQCAECWQCQRINEEQEYKKIQAKGQKDLLGDLYSNKQRPTLDDCLIDAPYYIIPADFVKEWRSIISQYPDLHINNSLLLCNHHRLPFSEHSFDPSKVVLLKPEEWFHLKENYENDGQEICVIKRAIPNETEEHMNGDTPHTNADSEITFSYLFDFTPEVCQICMEQNELDKFYFENKNVVIRLIEDDQQASVSPGGVAAATAAAASSSSSVVLMSNGDNQNNDDDDVIYQRPCKKRKLEMGSKTSGSGGRSSADAINSVQQTEQTRLQLAELSNTVQQLTQKTEQLSAVTNRNHESIQKLNNTVQLLSDSVRTLTDKYADLKLKNKRHCSNIQKIGKEVERQIRKRRALSVKIQNQENFIFQQIMPQINHLRNQVDGFDGHGNGSRRAADGQLPNSDDSL